MASSGDASGRAHRLAAGGDVVEFVFDVFVAEEARAVHLTFDPDADAAYVYLVDDIGPGEVRRTIPVDGATVAVDLDGDGRVLGIEILGASGTLRPETLGAARGREPSSDDPYRDPQLVELYDVDNPDGEDHAYYRALADEVGAATIVDLGCGTGLLTRSFVRPGRTVIGVDPSWTMLEYARRQPGAERVTWIHGDATATPAETTADLAVCTGNAIMHLAPEELRPALRRLAAVLREGGTLSFETRNPADRAWERWNRSATYGERDTPFGRLEEWLDVTEVDGGRVVFDAHNVFPTGEERVYTSILYFRDADEFRRELEAAGFEDIDIRGDWQGAPVSESSQVLVFRARRA